MAVTGRSCTGLRRVAIDLVWASWMTSVECNTGVMAEDEKLVGIIPTTDNFRAVATGKL